MAKSGETKVASSFLQELRKLMNEPIIKENLVSLKEVMEILEQTGYVLDYPIPNHNGLFYLQRYQLIEEYYYSLGIMNHPIFDNELTFEVHFNPNFNEYSLHTNNEFVETEIYKDIEKWREEGFFKYFFSDRHQKDDYFGSYHFIRESYLLYILGKNVRFQEEYFSEIVRGRFRKNC